MTEAAHRRTRSRTPPAKPHGAEPKPRPKRSVASPTRSRPGLDASSGPGQASSPTCSIDLAERYGREPWARRLDPTCELILTILTQNSADVNAEKAFVPPARGLSGRRAVRSPRARLRLGRRSACPDGIAPDWMAVEAAPLPELVEVIRPGGLPTRRRRGIQATLRQIRERRGDHSLEFLGDMAALDARDWLTSIPGIGKKTASVLLLFSFGLPLMPVDRHVERVAQPDRPDPEEGHGATTPMTSSSASSSPTRCTRRTSTSSSTAASCATPSAPPMSSARSGIAAASSTRRRPDLRYPPRTSGGNSRPPRIIAVHSGPLPTTPSRGAPRHR